MQDRKRGAMLDFGAWLKREREARGWSQEELARRTGTDGVTSAQIGNLESGRSRQPQARTKRKIEAAFQQEPAARC